MKKIALLTLLLINLSLSFSLPRNQASPAIFSVTKTNNSILFRHTDSTLTAIPCQSVASIVSNADPSKIVSVWVVQQGDYDKIMQFDYLVCGFSSKSDAVDSLTAWAICDTSSGGGGGGGEVDLATLIDACPNVDEETLNGSETFAILKNDTVYQLSLGTFADLVGGGGGGDGISDAPNNGNLYGRRNANWEEIVIDDLPTIQQNHFAVGNSSNEISDGGDAITFNGYDFYIGHNSTDTAFLSLFTNGAGSAVMNFGDFSLGDLYDKNTGIQMNINNSSHLLNINGRSDYSATINHTGSGDVGDLTFNYSRHRANKTYTITITDTVLLVQFDAGSFISGESFTTNNGASGTIGFVDNGSNYMTLKDVIGTIANSDIITGTTSGSISTVTFTLAMLSYTYNNSDTIIEDVPINASSPLSFADEAFQISQSHPLTVGDEWTVEVHTGFVGGLRLDYIADLFKFGATDGGNNTNIIVNDKEKLTTITSEKLKFDGIATDNTATILYGKSSDGNVVEVNGVTGYTGTATLSSGTVTVNTANVKTGDIIFVTVNTPSGTQGFLSAPTGSIVDGTSFVINSTNAGDNSTVNWWIAP